MDADGEHKPEYIPQFLEKFGVYNIVIGTKSSGKDGRSLYRQIVTKVFAIIARTILGLEIRDLSGFVLASKNLFAMVKPSDDFKFILPLIYLNRDAKICEVSINHPERKGGKPKANARQAFKILKLIFKLKLGLY